MKPLFLLFLLSTLSHADNPAVNQPDGLNAQRTKVIEAMRQMVSDPKCPESVKARVAQRCLEILDMDTKMLAVNEKLISLQSAQIASDSKRLDPATPAK